MTATKPIRKSIRLKLFLSTAAAIVTASICIGASILFLPRIDERLDFVTGRARRIVMGSIEGDRRVDYLVKEKYLNPRWESFHRDYLNETYVRCHATTREGKPVALQWVVLTRLNWRNPLKPDVLLATPQTKDAYNVAPSLYVEGRPLYTSVDFAN